MAAIRLKPRKILRLSFLFFIKKHYQKSFHFVKLSSFGCMGKYTKCSYIFLRDYRHDSFRRRIALENILAVSRPL